MNTRALTHELIVDGHSRSSGQPLDAATRDFMEPRLGQDPDAAAARSPWPNLQRHAGISQPDDPLEREADRSADDVMHSSQMAAAPADFSHVRVHTEADAAASARAIHAKAYTTGSDIVFAAGQYRPDTWAGRQLLAHELTHVLQQAGRANGGPAPAIQRAVEVRPPGRGEASAFDRRDELIARMNAVSGGMTYSLDGQRIAYEVRDEAALTNFDQQMRRLIDRAEVIPMRLITSAGRVPNGAGGFDPLLFDSFILGYVDLDDLLASDDNAFQLVLVHLLTERAAVRNYARRIGTDMSASFNRAHAAGRAAENEFIQNLVNDPSIRFNYEEVRPNGTLVVAWRSAAEGYRVFHVIRRAAREERGGEVWAQLADGTRLTIEQLIERRRAAAPAPAGP